MFAADECGISYGIDATTRRIVAVRSEKTRRGLKQVTVLDHAGRPDASSSAALTRMREEAQAGRASVSACMPAYESLTRWIRTPLTSLAKARKVLPSMLDIQLPFPIESCSCEFVQVARNTTGTVDALGVAARTEDIERRLALLEDLGVSADRLDHEGLALWARSVAEVPPERDTVRVVACLGEEHAVLVVGRGPEYIASHGIRMGLDELRGGPDRSRPLAQRARQVLLSLPPSPGDATTLWLWTGPGADPALTGPLQAALDGVGSLRFAMHDRPAEFLARALSARGLGGDATGCNLRAGALAHPRAAARAERQATLSAISCLAAGLLLCGLGLTWRAFLEYRRSTLQDTIGSLAAKLARTSRVPRGQEVLTVQRAIEQRAPTVTPFLRAVQPPLTGLLAGLLQAAREQSMNIENLSLTDGSVSLHATSPDWDRCEKLAAPLRAAGFSVSLERQDALADERVHFMIKGSRLAGGPAS